MHFSLFFFLSSLFSFSFCSLWCTMHVIVCIHEAGRASAYNTERRGFKSCSKQLFFFSLKKMSCLQASLLGFALSL